MAWRTSRAGSAPYEVVRSDGLFELRDYPAITVVETAMAGDDGGGSFGRLFGFISGRNETKRKIAMTTPVLMAAEPQTRSMAFVMPADFKREDVPLPADPAVTVREMPAGRFAVLRFRGGRNREMETQMLARLREWIKTQGLQAQELPIYAYFDPPWTPGFMKRNEVMLRTTAQPD